MKKLIIIIILPLAALIIILIKTFNIDELKTSKNTTTPLQKSNTSLDINKKTDFEFQIEEINNQEINSQQPSFALEIKGSDEFKSKVKNAVRLLWLYDKENSFRMLRRYVFEIRESNRTNHIIEEGNSIIELSSDKVKQSSLTFLASIIAHNAWHAYYYINTTKKSRKKIEIPHPEKEKIEKSFENPLSFKIKKFEDIFSIEKYAFDYQLEILKKIGSPQSEIKKLLNREENDFSLSHDGNYIILF